MDSNTSIVALDYGEARIGVALASSIARIASPYTTLPNDDHFMDSLKELIKREAISIIVVGYPRGLDGQTTKQTQSVEAFIDRLEPLGLQIFKQDEALTSAKAESELNSRNKPYSKGDIDALAATYILDDYLNVNEEMR